MATFSIENLRKLNMFHLLAINIPERNGASWALSSEDDPVIPSSGHPWKVSFYASNGVALDGSIQVTDPLASIGKGITSNKVMAAAAGLGTAFLGIAPQIDIAKKFLYSGVSTLDFTLTGCLALETDPTTDYYTPIDKLSYLTYPTRAAEMNFDDLFDALDVVSSQWFGAESKAGTAVRDMFGATYQNIMGKAQTDKQTSESSKAGWDTIKKWFGESIGKAYTMSAPPTFTWNKAGSGLDFRYGKLLISDVYIKSFKIEYPTLYYDEGLPALIPVTLSLGTFRPLTATMLNSIMQGQAQQWDSTGTVDKHYLTNKAKKAFGIK